MDKKVIVEWKDTRVLTVSYSKEPGQPVLGTIMLLNGMNEINQDVWEMVSLQVKHLIAKGRLVEYNIKKEEIPGKVDEKTQVKSLPQVKVTQAADFSKMKADEQEELVKKTTNLATLESWRSKALDSVRVIIDDRIAVIKAGGKKKK